MSKKFIERNEKTISLITIIAVILIWVSVFILGNPPQTEYDIPIPPSSEKLEGCYIEYGSSECIDGSLVTPFFNPGTEDLRRVSMYFYSGEDVDIYNCAEPLIPGDPGTLTTIPCAADMDTSRVKLEYCCGEDCYETMMDDPSEDLSLVRMV
jgi:hypothetical protein